MNRIKKIISSNKVLKYSYFIIFSFLALLSLYKCISYSFGNSSDIPWTTADLFWNNISPYEYYLNGNLDNFILWGQEPNKFHLFYIILLPLNLFDFDQIKVIWCILNLTFLLGLLLNIKKIFYLDNFNFFTIVTIFLISTPLRSSISEGQYSIFVFYFLSIFWVSENKYIKSINLSLSTIKYSLIPSFFILALFKERKIFFITSIILLISILIFAFQTESFYIEMLIQPLIIAKMTHTPGLSDLSTVMNFFLKINIFLSLAICVVISFLLVFLIKNSKDKTFLFTSLCIINLICFPHASYDYIFLLPLLCFFISCKKIEILDYIYVFPVFFYFYYEKLDVEYLNFFYPNGNQTSETNLIFLQSFGGFILLLSFFTLYFKQKRSLK